MTPRTEGRDTVGHEVAAIAESLGTPLMPWQKHWALVVGEWEWMEVEGIDAPIRVPSYREAMDTTPRQSGKTLLKVCQYLQRALLWESWDRRPQLLAYSAQSGSAARQKFTKEHVPILRSSPLWAAVDKPRYAAENAGLDFVNGAIMTIMASSKSAGHGSTIDLAILDEIFEDTDDRREQAMGPAMATRHDAQQLISSTAGDDASIIYNQKRAAGRAAVDADRRQGMAYVEYSMGEDDDPEDPRVWRSYHPALGFTITERTIQAELDKMKADPEEGIAGFKRAWGNIPQQHRAVASSINPGQWSACLDPRAGPEGTVVFGADATPDRSSASIVACDSRGVIEIVDHRPGADWVEPRLEDILTAHRGSSAIVWGRGPLAGIPTRVDAVTGYDSTTYADACGQFTDAIENGRLKVVPVHGLYPTLEAGVLGGVRSYHGDLWRWGRVDTDRDISPLVAATLAYHQAVVMKKDTTPLVAFG